VVEKVIPQLLQLLVDGYWGVRVTGANVMAKLAENSELPPISSVCCRSCTFQAELRAAVENDIQPLLQLLKDRNDDARVVGVNVMAKLAEYREFLWVSSV